jgi:hypothetical protein
LERARLRTELLLRASVELVLENASGIQQRQYPGDCSTRGEAANDVVIE